MSTASRFSSPLRLSQNLFWWIFLVWTAVGTVVMPFGIGEMTVRRLIGNEALLSLVLGILRPADAIWMVLAFGVVYLHVVESRGLATARLWALVILVGSGVVEALGAKTGWPFGPYRYTDNMGIRVFGVLPFTIPLAWFVIVATAQAAILALRPRWSRWAQAAFVGAVATLTDLNLEFIAWKVRAYWIWYPPGTALAENPPDWPPIQNYLSWFVLAFLLSAALVRRTGDRALSAPPPAPAVFPWRPVLVLSLMNALFLLVHLVRWLGLA